MDIVYAVLLWFTPWGAPTAMFDQVPGDLAACEAYITEIVASYATVGTSVIGKCTTDLNEVGRIVDNFVINLPPLPTNGPQE